MTSSLLKSTVKEITYRPKERVNIFQAIDPEHQPTVLLRLSKNVQAQLLAELNKDQVIPILERLDPDDTTDLLQTLPNRKQTELLSQMTEDLRDTVSMLLQFDPKTAAGLMSLNYIQVELSSTLAEVAELIQKHEKRTGKFPVILVLENNKLEGFLPLQKLIYAKPSDKAGDFVKKMHRVRGSDSFNSVISHFLDHPHQKIVVTNGNDAVLGVIYSDDVLRVLQETKASNLYDFAGVSNEETVFGSIKQKVRYRYKWLIINLATAFLASFVVGLFDATISKYVLLAVYMPIVAGMGGNSATQTLAVMVRGIALNQIELKSALPTLRKELGAALINGVINGVLVATVVIIFNHDVKIALILTAAMIINLLVAGFFGTLVPLIMVKLKKDPATSATIFITTATDVLGFLAFLGLATLLLGT